MMEFRTLTRAEMAPAEMLSGAVVLTEADGKRVTHVLHAGLRLRSFRNPRDGSQRLLDLRGSTGGEQPVVVSLGASALRDLARRMLEIAREIDGIGRADFGAASKGRRS